MEVDFDRLFAAMTEDLRSQLRARAIADPAMVGIYTGGAWVAERLHRQLALATPLGTLDISFYRDDFSRIGMHPQVRPSKIEFNVDNRHIILVDDVLYTGRTVRAALNEVFDFGRPASVSLVVLVERDGRELPIQAQVVGQHLTLDPGQHIKLAGPDPLALHIYDLENGA